MLIKKPAFLGGDLVTLHFESISKQTSSFLNVFFSLLHKVSLKQLSVLSDHHQRLRDVRDDPAPQQPRPARLPRQLRGDRG